METCYIPIMSEIGYPEVLASMNRLYGLAEETRARVVAGRLLPSQALTSVDGCLDAILRRTDDFNVLSPKEQEEAMATLERVATFLRAIRDQIVEHAAKARPIGSA